MTPRAIIIHATDAHPDGHRFETPEDVRRFHVDERGWSDCGYHFVLDRDGLWVPMRPIGIPGAHCKPWNTDSLGAAILGCEGAVDNLTKAQRESLPRGPAAWLHQYGCIPILGHHEADRSSRKACPVIDMDALRAEVMELYIEGLRS